MLVSVHMDSCAMAYGQYNIWIIKARKHTHAHTLAAHRALTQALNGIVQPSVFKSTDFGVLNGCIYTSLKGGNANTLTVAQYKCSRALLCAV